MSHTAEYETAQTLGADKGDIPAAGTRGQKHVDRRGI